MYAGLRARGIAINSLRTSSSLGHVTTLLWSDRFCLWLAARNLDIPPNLERLVCDLLVLLL